MSHNGHTTFCMQGMQIANLAVVLPVSATCLIPAHAVYTDTSVQIGELSNQYVFPCIRYDVRDHPARANHMQHSLS